MSHYELHAYIDRNAKRIDSMCVQTSSCVAEYMPKLAERAGLGKYLANKGNGWHTFEVGEIYATKVTERECS